VSAALARQSKPNGWKRTGMINTSFLHRVGHRRAVPTPEILEWMRQISSLGHNTFSTRTAVARRIGTVTGCHQRIDGRARSGRR
jgi:hypothetical protein